MIFLFFSFLSFVFKWQRFIFFLISLEFMVLSLFFYYTSIFFGLKFFLFLSFTVVSSVLGMIMMVSLVKFYGSDKCLF